MIRKLPAALAILGSLALTPSAKAQEAFALAVQGWQQHPGKDGIVYYSCVSDGCAIGSVVSYKRQPHRTSITLAEFEKHHRGLVAHNKEEGRVRDARLTDFKERTIEGVRVLQVSREVEWFDHPPTFTIEARLIGPSMSFSLVSDSPERRWTDSNFEGFLRSMINIVGIKAP